MKGKLLSIIALFCFVSQLDAQQKRERKPLETGAERKLGVVYKTVGKRNLEFDLYHPVAGTAMPCPVIVYTHGGGWAAGSRLGAASGSFGVVFKELVQQGFAVVSVDYRLYRKGGTVRMRDCVIDCKDAVRYLVKNSNELKIDPEKLFVFGDSAGGQLAQMLLLSPSNLQIGDEALSGTGFKAVAGLSWYGPCDFVKEDLFNHNDREGFRDRFGPRIVDAGVSPEEKLRLYQEMSPITYLKKDSPPLLMIQGDKDTTIPVNHAHYMKAKAEEIGAPVEVVIVHNAGHNWRKVDAEIEPSRKEIAEMTVSFFVDQLKLKE